MPLKTNKFSRRGDVVIVDVSTPTFPLASTVIDADMLQFVVDGRGRWLAMKAGDGIYVARAGRGPRRNLVYLHIYLLGRKPGKLVDHRDGETFNNRRTNLRHATRAQNSQNSKPNPNHSSLYKGVTLAGKRWRAMIRVRGKIKHLGYHSTQRAAAHSYDRAAQTHFGAFARPNFSNG